MFGLIRYTDAGELALLFVNNGDAPAEARVTQALFPEGPDGATPLPLDGAVTDEDGRACPPLPRRCRCRRTRR